ncbi:hypothetical protein ON010_g18547 [Phytophthora cinnamomi]|nr:hypothetical protein ON010_g18547 [Phytophthora cinnamomi]
MKKSAARSKMRALDLDDEDPKDPKSGWSEATLEYAFRQAVLRVFIVQDPVKRILDLKWMGDPLGPITAPTATGNKLTAVKDLMHLLREAGLGSGQFNPQDLFELDLEVIQSSVQEIFDKLKAWLGEIPAIPAPVAPDPVSATAQPGSTGSRRTSSTYVSAAEDGSDTSSEPQHMSLGPSGTSMIQARAQIQHEGRQQLGSKRQPATSVYPTVTTIGSGSGSGLGCGSDETTDRQESFFQTVMSRFLKEQQARSQIQPPAEP